MQTFSPSLFFSSTTSPDVADCLSAGRERHHAEVVALHEGYLQKHNGIMSAAAVHA